MPHFGEEMEADAALYTACTPPPLGSIALCNERFNKATNLSFLVKTHLAMLACVDDASDIRDGDTGLRNVGS